MLSRYTHILKSYKKHLIFLSLVAIISSILSLFEIQTRALVIDSIVYSNNLSEIMHLVLIAIFVQISSIAIEVINLYTKGILERKIGYKFKRFFLDELQKKDINHIKKFKPSYLSKRIDDDISEFLNFFLNNYANILIKFVELFIITIILFNINFYIGIISLIFIPFFYMFNNLFKSHIHNKNFIFKEQTASFFESYTTALENMEDIIINSELERKTSFLSERFILFLSAFKKDLKVKLTFDYFKSQLNMILTLAVILIGAFAFLEGSITIGLILASQFYIQRNQANFNYFMNLGKEYQTTKVSINRLDELLSMENVLEGTHEISYVENIRAKISYSLEGVSLIKEKELYAAKGDVVCISGKNGSGKSTLIKILIGFIKPKKIDNFEIIINGENNIKDINTLNFRFNNLAYLPQVIPSRKFKVREIFSEFEDSKSLITHLKNSNIPIYEDIELTLINKWEEFINLLSGGEQQLLYIISNSIKDKDIFILDEPTSNLDTLKIEWFKQLIKNIKKDKIIFIINHESYLDDIFDVIVKI